jgi:hypothetical protein
VVGANNGKIFEFITCLDNEVAATMEIIFSRYLYAIGFLRSCSGYINELRKAKEEKNTTRCGEILKSVMERLSNATIRILKLKSQENLIFVILMLSNFEIARIQRKE